MVDSSVAFTWIHLKYIVIILPNMHIIKHNKAVTLFQRQKKRFMNSNCNLQQCREAENIIAAISLKLL